MADGDEANAGRITEEDPRAGDIRELLGQHLALMRAQSEPENVHALDLTGLTQPSVSFFTYRVGGRLLGVGALKELSPDMAEVKSMHTAAQARGQGIGRAILRHLLAVASHRGYASVSLETGASDSFASAHRLYFAAGFAVCGPFSDYQASPESLFMTRAV